MRRDPGWRHVETFGVGGSEDLALQSAAGELAFGLNVTARARPMHIERDLNPRAILLLALQLLHGVTPWLSQLGNTPQSRLRADCASLHELLIVWA